MRKLISTHAVKDEADKYTRLFAMSGGGAVSQLQVENKKNALLAAENAMRVAQSRLSEQAARQSLEAGQAKAQLETSGQELTKLRLQSEAADREVANVEDKLKLQVQTARLVADAAARIKFENIDKENFLLIVAPVDGVITDVPSTQPGDKIQANAGPPRCNFFNAEDKLRLQVQTRAAVSADRASNGRRRDNENFLLIVASVDGVITDVTSTQPGDKLQTQTPLGGTASRTLMRIAASSVVSGLQ